MSINKLINSGASLNEIFSEQLKMKEINRYEARIAKFHDSEYSNIYSVIDSSNGSIVAHISPHLGNFEAERITKLIADKLNNKQ